LIYRLLKAVFLIPILREKTLHSLVVYNILSKIQHQFQIYIQLDSICRCLLENSFCIADF